MNGVGGGTTPLATEFWNLETGKLDATNGVAYVDFKVYPTNETITISGVITTFHKSFPSFEVPVFDATGIPKPANFLEVPRITAP